MITTLVVILSAITAADLPYSNLGLMDGHPNPNSVQNVMSGQQFVASLESFDDVTWQRQDLTFFKSHSVDHIIECTVLRSGTHDFYSLSNIAGTVTLLHGITAWTLESDIQYQYYVDDYQSRDANGVPVHVDPLYTFNHTVKVSNPEYVPPRPGG